MCGARGGGGADCRGCVDRRALVAPRAPDGAMNVRRLVVFLHDLVAAALAWMAAYWLRFNLDVPHEFAVVMLARLPLVIGVHVAVFWLFGLYRGLWRYASLPDLRNIVMAVGIAALAVPTLVTLLARGGALHARRRRRNDGAGVRRHRRGQGERLGAAADRARRSPRPRSRRSG